MLGSDWLVAAGRGRSPARWALSEVVIGLTIVAAGTSLPEVATSVVASAEGRARHRRRQRRRQQHLQHPRRRSDWRRWSPRSAPAGAGAAARRARFRPLGDAGGRGRLPAGLLDRTPRSRAGRARCSWATTPPTPPISCWPPSATTALEAPRPTRCSVSCCR
ncbi:MAG: hypothetical protein MZW92_81005 [Comamonadaceae bacterium]|nr:hypothetical protein [Comamonadaceae bacterium]